MQPQQQQPQPQLNPLNPAPIEKKSGLGGFDINTSQAKKGDGSTETTKTKDSQLPNEILVTIEQLKNHIKQQKSESSDIARSQSRKLTIQNEIQGITLNIQEISNTLDSHKATAKTLRNDTSRLIRHVELAQRTYEIPAGLQFENSAPLQFFMEMTQKNESELLTLKNLIATVENHMNTLANPQHLSVEALKMGFQQLHESFVALAGRLYKIHQQVQEQKEQYLNLRKYFINDGSKVLEGFSENKKTDYSVVSAGPNPF